MVEATRQVRVDDDTMDLIKGAQQLLEEIGDPSHYSLGETINYVVKDWLKTALEVLIEDESEEESLRNRAIEIHTLTYHILSQ